MRSEKLFLYEDREAEPVALRFAAMGYHAAVLRYSTYGDRRDDFAKLDTADPVKPHVLYPAQLRELGRAMLLLRARGNGASTPSASPSAASPPAHTSAPCTLRPGTSR